MEKKRLICAFHSLGLLLPRRAVARHLTALGYEVHSLAGARFSGALRSDARVGEPSSRDADFVDRHPAIPGVDPKIGEARECNVHGLPPNDVFMALAVEHRDAPAVVPIPRQIAGVLSVAMGAERLMTTVAAVAGEVR